MNKFTYYVKDQKSVTAVLDDLSADLSTDLVKSFRRSNIDPSAGFHFFGKIFTKFFQNRPTKIRAKAKLSPNDTWDEEFGRDIARARLTIKVNATKADLYNEMLDQLYTLVEELEIKRDIAEDKIMNAIYTIEDKEQPFIDTNEEEG